LKVKVQAPPEMGLEEVERAGTPVVTRDQIRQVGRSAGRQVGRSAGRQVAIIRTEKDPARRLGLGCLNGNARLGLPRTTKTPHGLATETSA
jgi:hypothetical protein